MINGREQQVFLGVEITKLHERSLRGRVSQVYEALNSNPDLALPALKGEITLVLAPYAPQFNVDLARRHREDPIAEEEARGAAEERLVPVSARNAVAVLDRHFQASPKQLAQIAAELLGVSKNQAYRLVLDVRAAPAPSGLEDDEDSA